MAVSIAKRGAPGKNNPCQIAGFTSIHTGEFPSLSFARLLPTAEEVN